MSKRPNGKGNLQKYGNGKWRLRLMLGYSEEHKPIYATATGKDESECEKNLEKSIKENMPKVCIPSKSICSSDYRCYIDYQCNIDYHTITLVDLCTKHLEWKLSKKDMLKPKSADRIEGTINNQIAKYDIGSYQVAAVTSDDVEIHIEYLISESGLSVSSIKKVFDIINAAFKWAIDHENLEKNPCTKIKAEIRNRFKKIKERHSTDSDVIVLSDEEKELFEAEAKKREPNGKYKYVAGPGGITLIKTGIRVGELCAVRIKNFDPVNNTLSIEITRGRVKNRDGKENENSTITIEGIVKNCHCREIRLPNEVAEIIKELIRNRKNASPDDYIFVNTKGKPMEASSFGARLNTIFRNAGLDISISGSHVLRRTFSTDEHDRGVDTIDIAAYIGDTPETVTKHYISTGKKIRAGNVTKNIIEMPKSKTEKAQQNIK